MAKIIAQRAKEMGVETHCFSIDVCSVAADAADYCHCVDILDVELLVEVCSEIGIDGIVATTELTIFPAAYVASRLGLNGNDIQVSKEITNKAVIREKVKNVEELKQPNYWICKNEYIAEPVHFPVIVKPIAAGGKRGISVVHSAEDMVKAISAAIKVSKVEGALVEEFLGEGREYSVESLSFHGKQYIIQITEKVSSGPPHCVELGHHQPADLTIGMRKKVEEVVAKTLSAAGIENGACHTEIKIINNDIYLIEINGRPGGDHIAYPLTELSTGYPYISGIIAVALNTLDESRIENLKNDYSGVLFVTSQTSHLKLMFDNCEKEPWFYKKNYVSDELKPIIHNDGFNTNYFMYYSTEERPNFTITD